MMLELLARRSARRELIRCALAAGATARLGTARARAQATPPADGVQTETLLAMTLPAGLLPLDEISYYRMTEQAGVTAKHPSYEPMRIVLVQRIIAGEVVPTSDSPLAVLRAGASTFELIPAHMEATLNPGDQVVYFDGAAATTVRHPSAAPAVVLGLQFTAATPQPADSNQVGPEGVTVEQFADYVPDPTTKAALTGVALTVAVQRLTLAPGASLPLSDERYPILRYVESGKAARQVITSGAGATPTTPAVFSGGRMPWAPLGSGRRLSLANAGGEPLVLLAESIRPADPAATILVAPTPAA